MLEDHTSEKYKISGVDVRNSFQKNNLDVISNNKGHNICSH